MFFKQIPLDGVEEIHVLEPLVEANSRVSFEGAVFYVVFKKVSPELLGQVVVFDKHTEQRIALLFVQSVLGKCVVEVGDDIYFLGFAS